MRIRGYRAGLLLATSSLAFAGAAEAAETVVYGYDSLGRLIRVERTGNVNNGLNTNYSYDCAGNRANVTAGPGVPAAPPPPACAPPPPPGPPSPPPGNQPPTAVIDSASIPKCGSVTRDVVANDSDPEGNIPLSLTGVSYAGNKGSASLSGSTSVLFESVGLSGTAAITYTVQDSFGAASSGTFNVTITTVDQCL